MIKHEFIKRFQLHSLQQPSHHYQQSKTRQAAVLIPLIVTEQGLQVLLTKRSIHLKHHAGQVSFPGGKVEPNDKTIIDTALREAHEEIGLAPELVNIIGQLHPYQVRTGFSITPIVGVIENPPVFIQDDNEVAEIFQVPLQYFIKNEYQLKINILVKGKPHPVYFTPYKHYNIWGATSAMLVDLINHIK